MSKQNHATLRDAQLTTTKAFPAAAASNNSASLEIGGGDDYGRRKNLEVIVELPENTALVADKDITVKLQDSADDETFTDVALLGAVVVTGKTGNGMPDTDGPGYAVQEDGSILIAFPCPRGLKKHVRANVAVETGGGTLTALEYTVSVVGY